MKALIIFGSKSDHKIYGGLEKELKNLDIKTQLEVASAHRTPEKVKAIIESTDADVVIAGAGLSAALPGVVASHTIKPVIGIPCEGGYQGLDALLSIAQMPSGIPVLSVGVNQTRIAAQNAKNMSKDFDSITIVGDKETTAAKKATAMLEKFEALFKFADKPDSATVNIEFCNFDEPIEKKDELVIYCPTTKDNSAEAALNLLKHSDHGLWVGLNNGKNAALAAIEILNITGNFNDRLKNFREEQKKK